MKKKAYRATEVKKINIEQMVLDHGEKKLLLGIDVAKTDYCSHVNVNENGIN